MTQANTSDFGRRVGPVDFGDNPSHPPADDAGIGALTPSLRGLDPSFLASAAGAVSEQLEPSGASLFFKPRATEAQGNTSDTGQRVGGGTATRGAPTNAQGTEGMAPGFQASLNAMIAASGGRLSVKSGFRDEALQVKLWNQKLAETGGNEAAARKWVAKPQSLGGGGSNHTRGIAADLAGDLEWAHANAPRYGLIFPMSWENWHIEPVGAREHSPAGAYTDDITNQRPNPTQDSQINQDPAVIAAHLTSALQGGVDESSVFFHPQNAAPATDQAAGQTQGGIDIGKTGDYHGGGGNVDPKELYKQMIANGLDPAHAAAFVAIAGRESGYNAGAHNGNRGTGDDSYGLFQINLLGGQHSQYNPAMLTTAEGSARAAAEMYHSGGSRPWGPYKNVSWMYNTQPYWNTAIAASGGQVSLSQLQALVGEGL